MEWLKAILGDDLHKQVETAINAHNGKEENKDKPVKLFDLSSGEYTSINKFNDEVTARTNAEKQLQTANDLIAQLRKGTKDDPDIQEKITKYETEITKLKNELAETKLESAISTALRDAKGQDVDYLAFKLKAMDGGLELDDTGKIKGIDEKIATLKTQYPNQFGKASEPIKVDPKPLPNGDPNAKVTKTDIMKMSYSDRVKYQSENPDEYSSILNG